MTLRRIADACGGILHIKNKEWEPLAYQEIDNIVTDSRQAGNGSLFAAIVGERTDGHKYIPAVFAQGAVCVLSEQELADAAGPWIKVPSTLAALRDIAEYYLGELGIPVVGVTGSVGKTSTKEMIAAVLSQKFRTLKTQGNFNNELGLPLTVFRLTKEDEIAVLEMGISHFGEMHRLAKIARPDTCVITNIGQCHLEFLKDRDGVLKAKTEIFDFLDEKAHIILNGEDDKLNLVRNVKGIEPVRFGICPQGADADPERAESMQQSGSGAEKEWSVWADELEGLGIDGIRCRIHTPSGTFKVTVPIPGRHMVMNALAGTAVGLTYGMSLEEIRAGIESLETVGGRFHIIHAPCCTVIDDCYNANPMSMRASLGILKDVDTRTVAVLGDMGELGSDEIAIHRELGKYAAECGVDLIIGIGELSASLIEGIKSSGKEQDWLYFRTVQDFLDNRAGVIKKGDTVLIKASHFMQFDKIVETLSADSF